MPQFDYIARTTTGDKVTGVLEAVSQSAAARALGEKSLFPVRIAEQAQKPSQAKGPRLSGRELAGIYEQLADLLRAGVPLLRALETLTRTNSNQRIAGVVKQIQEDVATGKALEEAMLRQPTVFTALQAAMVRAGERGGFLESVLTELASFLERQDELRSKVRGALIYPCLLVVTGVAIVIGCLLWMVPKFKPIFEGRGDLPLPTRMLFAASDSLMIYWPMTTAGLVLGSVALALFLRTPPGQRLWIHLKLGVPVVGHAIKMVAVTRFCRVLGTMLEAGVPLLAALGISRDAVGLAPLAVLIDNAMESVRHGRGLAGPLREGRLFPPQVVEMVAVAEESNQLEKVLLKIADTVERRTNRQVDMAVRLLEPAILVLLAAAILFVALGLLYPIFTMARTLKS
jgi:general secretion pathway protein F/type IV pilus assembly protein PilC